MSRITQRWTTCRFWVAVLLSALTLALIATCAPVPRHLSPTAGTSAVAVQAADVGKVVRSRHTMVVSGSPLASRAGLLMLQRGGNAVDAAVATAFALAVVEFSMSGLGGRTQMIVRIPTGKISGLDSTTQVPSGYRPGRQDGPASGYATIGIPGSVLTRTRVLQQCRTWLRASQESARHPRSVRSWFLRTGSRPTWQGLPEEAPLLWRW